MTKLLRQALEAVSRLPPGDQDDIAEMILALTRADLEVPEPIDPTHLQDVLESRAQAHRRQFASEAEIAAAFDRFGA